MFDSAATLLEAGREVSARLPQLQQYGNLTKSPEYADLKNLSGKNPLNIVYFASGTDTTPTEAFVDDNVWYVDNNELVIASLNAQELPQNAHVVHQSAHDFQLPEGEKADIILLRNADTGKEASEEMPIFTAGLKTGGLFVVNAWGTNSEARALAKMADFDLVGVFDGKQDYRLENSNNETIVSDLRADAKNADGFDKYGGVTFVFKKRHHSHSQTDSAETPPTMAKYARSFYALQQIQEDTALTPEERYSRSAAEVAKMGPLPIKVIQTLIPFIQLKGDKTDEDRAYLKAFRSIRSNFGEVDPVESAKQIEQIPAIAKNTLKVNQGNLIGQASVSEVYESVSSLHPNKQLVTKVQKPNAKSQFKAALDDINAATQAFPMLSGDQKQMIQTGTQLAQTAYEAEFDTHQEIDSLQKLRSLGIRTPRVYPDLSSDTSITMERVEGQPLSEWSQTATLKDRRKVAGHYLASLFKMVRKKVLHGDPHAGNVMVDPKNRLHWIDPSPLITFTTAQVRNLIGLTMHIRNNDKSAIIDSLNHLAQRPLNESALSEIKNTATTKDGIAFYASVFKAGLVPPTNTILLARSMAEAVGTVVELLPEKQSKLRWAQILLSATTRSIL